MENQTDLFSKELENSARELHARVEIIPPLLIDYTKTIRELALTVSSNTLEEEAFVWGEEKYKSPNKLLTETIVLLTWEQGFGITETYKAALRWALQNELKMTLPHVPFTIGAFFPNLNQDLRTNHVTIVETTGYGYLPAAGVHGAHPKLFLHGLGLAWDKDSKKKPNIFKLESQGACGSWFAFRK